MLTIIEKVLLLQQVDIFENTSTEDLSHIAAITEQVNYTAGKNIYQEGDIPDAMYIVINGEIRLHQQEKQVLVAGDRSAFGTWALLDDEPRVATATTIINSECLRIDREDFYDLLTDHTNITQGILKTLSKRLRNLYTRVTSDMVPGNP
ncbi:cyclic nucleotide-binding domain-containing protein [candidate division KSB1 bacterium]|nr:cyclic nucleotide-binding domain-containing protein [candidate division KSB1 bacterium]